MKFFYSTVLFFAMSTFLVSKGFAQYTVSPSFSVLKGANNDKPVLLGGGLQAGYQLNPNLHLGIAYSFYPAKGRERQYNPSFKAAYKDQASNVAITAAYLFLNPGNVVRPLLGLDAGMNFAKQEISFTDFYTGNRKFEKSVTNILASPKAGVVFRMNKWVSLIPQVQYHLSVQKRKEELVGYTITGEPIKLSPIQNFYTASVALSVRF